MAIDDAEKRKSISGIHLYAAGPGVTPNASKDQEWRQEVGYSYSGIAAASPGGFEIAWTVNSNVIIIAGEVR